MGYWGDVLFPALALPQLLNQIEFGLPSNRDDADPGWCKFLQNGLHGLWRDYPMRERRTFGVVHCYRISQGTSAHFGLTVVTWSESSGEFATREIDMPLASSILHIAGSGIGAVKRAQTRWQESDQGGTSRAVYSAFVDAIQDKSDSFTGGAPQIASLWRIGGGKLIGTVVNRRRYFGGASVDRVGDGANCEWRNELFERVDGQTKKRISTAQRHVRPTF